MTTLSTDFSSNHRVQAAEFRRQVYLANGWNSVRRWNGRDTSLVLAGISGPSQDEDSWTPAPVETSGDCNEGIHVFRYRYLDSKTGYVSNPSEERTVEISSGGQTLTFPIDTSGATNIIRSSDSKVDTIVIEMTTRGSTVFFEAARGLQSASSLAVSITDAALEAMLLPWPEDGNDPPPVAKNIVSFREHIWCFGQVVHAIGTADFTNASADVDENTAPDWNTEALGSAAGESSTEWLIQKDGDTAVYAVSYYDSGNNKIVLKENYGGATTTDDSYVIYSRTNVVWVSRPGFPEGFRPLRFINGPNGEMSGDLTAGIGYYTSMVFFSLSGMYQLLWDSDPVEDGSLVSISTQRGALNQRVVLEVEGRLYGMDYLGWWRWGGGLPEHISSPIDEVRDSDIDYSQAEFFHAVYLPKIRAIRWFVSFTGETYPKHYVQLDIDTGAWGTGEYKQAISESRLVPTATGPKAYLGDENGYVWEADINNADGVTDGLSHVTVDTATSTLVATQEVFGSVDVCNGAFAYSVDLEEFSLITDQGLHSITVSGFSAAPAAGSEIWIGPIPATLKTRAFMAPSAGPRHKLRPLYVYLGFQPSSSGCDMWLRSYENYSATAKVIDKSDSRNDLPGLGWPAAGESDQFTVDLSYSGGVVRAPMGGEFSRSVEIELEALEPGRAVELFYISLGSKEREGLA